MARKTATGTSSQRVLPPEVGWLIGLFVENKSKDENILTDCDLFCFHIWRR